MHGVGFGFCNCGEGVYVCAWSGLCLCVSVKWDVGYVCVGERGDYVHVKGVV